VPTTFRAPFEAKDQAPMTWPLPKPGGRGWFVQVLQFYWEGQRPRHYQFSSHVTKWPLLFADWAQSFSATDLLDWERVIDLVLGRVRAKLTFAVGWAFCPFRHFVGYLQAHNLDSTAVYDEDNARERKRKGLFLEQQSKKKNQTTMGLLISLLINIFVPNLSVRCCRRSSVFCLATMLLAGGARFWSARRVAGATRGYEHHFVSSSSVIVPKCYLLLLLLLQDDACAALLSTIPNGIKCGCNTVISGLIDVAVEAKASCALPLLSGQAEPCTIEILGKGSGLSFALGGGTIDLGLDSACDLGPGSYTLAVDGSLTLAAQNPISVSKCTINLQLDETGADDCSCTFGCEAGNPFSAKIACETTTVPNDCLDFTEIASTLDGVLGGTQA
jgi:hypothetical protein